MISKLKMGVRLAWAIITLPYGIFKVAAIVENVLAGVRLSC